jgi:hypothetical protein
MPQFVEEAVRKRAGNPSESATATLLIGHDGNSAAVQALIEDVGGDVLEDLPFDSVTAAVPETGLETVISHSAVESVELDSGMETLEGN